MYVLKEDIAIYHKDNEGFEISVIVENFISFIKHVSATINVLLCVEVLLLNVEFSSQLGLCCYA